MTRIAANTLIGLCGLAAVSAPAFAQEYAYIDEGTTYEVAVVTAPAPAWDVGAGAVSALEQARGRTASSAASTPAPRLSWFGPVGAPFAPGSARPDAPRTAVVFARTRFAIGPELEHLRVLYLRARYQDGLSIRINDVEVVRRCLASAATPLDYADRAHGPEWESFYVDLAAAGLKLLEGNNELLVEVRPSSQRHAPLFELMVSAGVGGRIVRGPMVQRVQPDRALIVFETDLPTKAEVRYGDDRRVLSADVASTRHRVELTGLEPDSEVRYQIKTGAERTPELTFHTAPRAGEVVRFVVYGDVRSGHDVHARLVDQVLVEAPDFVVATGDLVYWGGDQADWQRFFSVAAPLLARIPLYPALGNHDEGGDPLGQVFDLPPLDRPEVAGWYGFDVGDVHFAVIDSNRFDDRQQIVWLDQDLDAARKRGARALFAVCHRGPWSRGPHGGDVRAANEVVPILERHGVMVLFSGHDHLYQRGRMRSLRYVVSGGGGAPLYQARCGRREHCPRDGTEALFSEHHYVVVEVYRDFVRMCAKRPDGTPLEACVSWPIRLPDPAVPARLSPSAPP